MKLGRPTKFLKTYCEDLLVHMANGGSFESFAGVIGVGVRTLYSWVEQYEEFLQAKQQGEAKALLFFERLGIQLARGEMTTVVKETVRPDGSIERQLARVRGDSRAWSLSMKNRFRWVEPIRFDQRTGVTEGLKDPADMTDEELERELSALKKRRGEL